MPWVNTNPNKITRSETRPLSLEHEIWELIEKDGEKATVTTINRSSKNVTIAWVINKDFTLADVIDSIKTGVKPIKLERLPVKEPIQVPTQKTKKVSCISNAMAVVNIADFHLNRYIQGEETYGQDYNIQIATEVFHRIIDQAKMRIRCSPYHIDKIIINTAGDFINSEANGLTTHGTPQTNDVSWRKCFHTAYGLLEYAIRELSQLAPVEYHYVAGNHDEQIGYMITTWLQGRFIGVDNVTINDAPTIRKIVEYGSNLIIFTHGSEEGNRVMDIPFVEPKAVSKISQSTNIEIISGHLHKNLVSSERGVRLEVLKSACPAQDNWTYQKAYDGSHTEATIIFYDDYGRVQQDTINTNRILQNILETM
jgi:hypothetical protein